MKSLIILIVVALSGLWGCVTSLAELNPDQLVFERVQTKERLYQPGEGVELEPIIIDNRGTRSVGLDSMVLLLCRSDAPNEILKRFQVSKSIISPGANVIEGVTIETSGLQTGGYLVTLSLYEGSSSHNEYLTFFRLSDDEMGLSYSIGKQEYEDLSVLTLSGGLSAEYTVQKAGATLVRGISHSWNIPEEGHGPEPIPSTPDFLERSVNYTVEFYNELLGESEPIETVVITTGIPSGAYLASTMNAPALPIHFLVGTHTTREIQTILDYSQANGMEAYATVGHDYSLSENQAVAWIKMLSLPPAYEKFLRDHRVKNVLFHGALGRGGESGARKLIDENGHYAPGSIYLMHFAGDHSEKYLSETIRDFDTTTLEDFEYISDWEAGVISEQIEEIGDEVRRNTEVAQICFFTTEDAIQLWNAAAYSVLHLYKKNNVQPTGISMNPYLIGNPYYEMQKRLVPFLYWQGISPTYHIDNRLETVVQRAFEYYFGKTHMKALNVWVNSTNNFGGMDQGIEMAASLRQRGYNNLLENDLNFGEMWDLSDGYNAPCEIRAKELSKMKLKDIEPLSIDDLKEIATQFEGLIFVEL